MEFQNICNEIGWPRFFCTTLYVKENEAMTYSVEEKIPDFQQRFRQQL